MCLLSISVKNTLPKVVKLDKIAVFIENIFKSAITIPLRVWGRLGPARVSQILPCFSRLVRDRNFEWKVKETSEILENDFGGVGACSCSLNTCLLMRCLRDSHYLTVWHIVQSKSFVQTIHKEIYYNAVIMIS